MRRLPPALLAVPALVVARFLPADGAGLFVRLAAASAVALLPGVMIARAIGLGGASAALVWALAALAAALAVVFAVHASIVLAIVVLVTIGAAALPFALRRSLGPRSLTVPLVMLCAGTVLGVALWRVAGPVEGDALFHLARVRKLDALGDLTPHRVGEFRGGGLHPGYAFPLWHGFLAVVARLAGLDPTAVVEHESSVLAPLAVLVAWEAGRALFVSRWAGVALAAAQVALIALAPGHGGAYRALALPATASRQLLVLAALALVFAAVAAPSRALVVSVAAAAGALALVHPTYALFLLLPVAGWAIATFLLARRAWRRFALVGAACAVPTAVVLAALYRIARDSRSLQADSRCGSLHGIRRHLDQLDVHSCSSYALKPGVVDRGGAVAVAALALVPLAALVWRRRWAAFVLGGSTVVFAVTLLPFVFPRLADAVSLSQARRVAGFLPLTFAFAGGLGVATRLVRIFVLPLALGAGIALQLVWPGDFGYVVEHGGPPLVTWFAFAGGVIGLVVAAVTRRWSLEDDPGPLTAAAAILFVLPVAFHAFHHWSPPKGQVLSAGLVRALRTHVPRGDVVLSDPETSYRIAAQAPVYVVAVPITHVADTRANRPRERIRDVTRYLDGSDSTVPRRYGAHWLVLDRRRTTFGVGRSPLYADGRYALYRL
jgi:hypothetical protein